ncbi:MAG: hypothetical protein ACQES4_10265 [Bacillota bacterium]
MASLAWYRKVYWITQREFPRWLLGWDSIWTFGDIILGNRVKECMLSDLCAILSDVTNISYDDELFYALMNEYYKEENETPEVTVDKLYRLRIEINKAERHTSFAERRKNLEQLAKATDHSVCKSFLLNAIADHLDLEGLRSEANETLAAMPHERRRSFAFIRRLFDLQWDEENYPRYYALITHPGDQATFEKMNNHYHLNIG